MVLLPKTYEAPPTRAQQRELQRLRDVAEATPLERGQLLAWNGPSRYDDVLPPLGYPNTPITEPLRTPPSDIPRREALTALLSPSGPAYSATPWTLKFVEPLQSEIKRSQVWRCTASKDGSTSRNAGLPVILKLLHQSLFPFPPGLDCNPEADEWDWWAAKYFEEEEADSYAAIRTMQGSEIPFCYGYYDFNLPCGEVVTGLILEDLTEIARPLVSHCQRAVFKKALNLATVDALASAAFKTLRRMHCSERGSFAQVWERDIFVVKDSPLSSPQLIFLDFANSRHLSVVLNHKRVQWEQALEAGEEEGEYDTGCERF